LIGALITGLANWLELAVEPPAWAHIVLWLPLTILAVLGSLRFAEAMLLSLEYRHGARVGRSDGVRR
jgi:uncharacterized protein (DUF983 family)